MNKLTYRRTGGFSLVELMVSVVIGLLAVLFATRIMTDSERSKDAALGGSDSMQNGMLAMFAISGDAEQAGFGLNDPLLMGCPTHFKDSQKYALPRAPGEELGRLVAAVIEPNANGSSDRLTLFSGAAFAGSPTLRLMKDYGGGTSLEVDIVPTGFKRGDVIVVAPYTRGEMNCALTQVGADPADDKKEITIGGGADLRFLSGELAESFKQEARIFNLGPGRSLGFHTWSVEDGFLRLRSTDLDGAGEMSQAVTDNIVAFKAQYGFDTRTGNSYTPLKGSQVDRWSAELPSADADSYGRVVALRLALVARSKNPEREAADGTCSATTVAPTVFASAQPKGVAAVPVKLDLAVAGEKIDWKCYHYRVYETIVPLRNAGWRP